MLGINKFGKAREFEKMCLYRDNIYLFIKKNEENALKIFLLQDLTFNIQRGQFEIL